MDAEEIVLQKCKNLIQAKLGWEDSDSWTNHDFQMLSDKILAETGINLSVATLKRLWGKVKYDSKPTITTLNTLALFLGHENWRAFKQANTSSNGNGHAVTTANEIAPTVVAATPRRRQWRRGLVGTVLCGGIMVVFLYAMRKEKVAPNLPAQYTFSSKKIVSEGVPNSVIFDYDASAAPVDSVFIQQSWDERLRTQVSRDHHQHTSIYYNPGFFQAKLVVGKQIVKEHNVWITSKGWMAMVRQKPVPVYFNDSDFRKPGMLSLPIEKLKESNIPFQPETPLTSYYNVKDFGDIRTDDFVFETVVRSDYQQGAGVCQFANVVLLLEGSIIMIPLSIKGCVSDLYLNTDDEGVSGKKADLSAFGCDMAKWVKIKCEVKNKNLKIAINGQAAYERAYSGSKRIVGLVYHFQGTGSIKEVSLAQADGQMFFEDRF